MRRFLLLLGLTGTALVVSANEPVVADTTATSPATPPSVAPSDRGPATVDTTASAAAKPDSASATVPSTPGVPAPPAQPPVAAPGMAEYMKSRMHGMPPRRMAPPDTAGTSNAVAVPAMTALDPDSVYDEDKALEIKLKTDPEAARRYRSPRKAFFFSLLLPGAGQIYTGSYVRAGLFAAAELGIGIGWYQVAVVQSREKATQAREFAAAHWRQERYEKRWEALYSDTAGRSLVRQFSSPQRASYCASLYGEVESPNRTACSDNPAGSDFGLHLAQFAQGGFKSTDPGAWNQQQVLDFRAANIKNRQDFEDMIGRYQEFLPGWEDNPDTVTYPALEMYVKSVQELEKDPTVTVVNPWGASAMRDQYLSLRKESDDLARTQKWFLGAMVINHLASAFDAALTANRMNKRLLHLETSWLDELHVHGGLAWVGSLPATRGQVDWTF
ncbi:MAG TPA: hypothetical protein PKO15_05970 [Fibrobacteria bacterium]|nr:hypothetical protein [Fibrobacteria bacterium]